MLRWSKALNMGRLRRSRVTASAFWSFRSCSAEEGFSAIFFNAVRHLALASGISAHAFKFHGKGFASGNIAEPENQAFGKIHAEMRIRRHHHCISGAVKLVFRLKTRTISDI